MNVFWVTKQDRQLQRELLSAAKAILVAIERPNRALNKYTRPKILTEDQIEDLAESVAISNGQKLHYEDE